VKTSPSPASSPLPASSQTLRRFTHLATITALLSATGLFAQTETPLWPDAPAQPLHAQPETSEDKRETGRLDRWIGCVSIPTITLYPAPGDNAASPAVLVIPGGGFRYVCIDKEGHEVARWLNSLGITAAVLKYRTLAPDAERSGKTITPLIALGDTSRAMRLLRARATEWKIDPSRIGMMGFSAGGVMGLQLMIDPDAASASAADPVDKVSDRPSFIALVYTAIPGGKLPKADKSSPPVFIAHASDDPKAPATNAVKIYQHFAAGGASAELHIFSKGDHGFGVMPNSGAVRNWTRSFAEWLRDHGMLNESAPAK
jgi:acetyl esterase/lipase